MRRAALLALALLVAGGTAAAPAAAGAAAHKKAPRCAGKKPTLLAFAPAEGRAKGVLSWKRPRRPKGGKLRYRVARNGKVVGQTRRAKMPARISAGHVYRFTVRVVSRRGKASPCVAKLRYDVRHVAPTSPANLAASDVSDSAATLTWGPGRARTGRRAGYRIYRDGEPLRQVPDLRAVVTLASATSYGFVVRTVDTAGAVSAPSNAVTVSTAAPPATTGRAHAFLLATTGQSFTDLRANYQRIGTLYPTYYECAADATISGRDDPLVTRWSQARRIRVMPRIDCQSQTRLHKLLTDPATRAAVLAGLGRLAAANGYDGLNVDFESGAPEDRTALTSFVSELAQILHGQGRRVSVAVSATTQNTTTGRAGFYDYAALGAVADTVFVMNWGKHWSTSAPGALADLPWATAVADYVATMPNKSRYVLGTGLYGMDWRSGGGVANPATPLEHDDVSKLIAATGATPVVDPVAGAPHFSYVDPQGAPHDVWYTDAASVDASIRMARDRGLGFGVWRLGREDPGIWANPLLAGADGWPE